MPALGSAQQPRRFRLAPDLPRLDRSLDPVRKGQLVRNSIPTPLGFLRRSLFRPRAPFLSHHSRFSLRRLRSGVAARNTLRNTLPSTLFDTIADHLRRKGNQAGLTAWDSAQGEEDTMTGDVCSQLRAPWSTATTKDATWQWRVDYTKLRGRGQGAPEKTTGCDGVVFIEISPPGGSSVISKGLLFQAKKGRLGSRADLLEQVTSMEQLAPNGTAVFEYSPDRFTATPGADFLESSPQDRRDHAARASLGSFLADEFLSCTVGVLGMYFDAVRQVLVAPTGGAVTQRPFAVPHRLRIEVVGNRRAGAT